jgi:glycosyltransferase involved in cell wall biosynthesis
MRSFLFIKAASLDFTVKVLLVPVAGTEAAPDGGGAVLPLPGAGQLAASAAALLASPCWRERIGAAYPLPMLATLAPPTLAADAERLLRPRPGTPVHVARSYLAPLGIALAERIGSDWATLDLDDDDQQLAAAAGHEREAAACGRLVSVFAPLFQGIALAAPGEAAAVSRRHGITASVLPNSVALAGAAPAAASPAAASPAAAPAHPAPAAASPSRAVRRALALLFVGNLTYWPNADAAIRLVREILPRARALTTRPVTVTLAGEHGGNPDLLALADVPGVRLAGFVPDLAGCYREADVLVAPLLFAAGTRIKLLEAFAQGVPVVTTSQGAAGLEVRSGQHALIADSAEEMASAVARLGGDAALAARLAGHGRELVRQSYSHEVVIPQIRAFFAAAAAAAARPRPV